MIHDLMRLESVLAGILIKYGPDGHSDGSDVLTQFVVEYCTKPLDALQRWEAHLK